MSLLAATTTTVWFTFFAGAVIGGFAVVMLFLVALLGASVREPRRVVHRQAARELNQAFADYFGGRSFDGNDALLIRLRAAADAHYEALVDLDRVEPPASTPLPAGSRS